jgi:hypothetical protein
VILLSIDSLRVNRLTKEAVVFSVFINVLISFIIFKKAFLSYGLHAVWQNIPVELLFSYFKDITVLEIISGIGVIPLLFGVLGFTFGMFKEKRQYIYLLSAMILADLLLLLLRLVNFSVGVLFLGVLLAIISAIAFETISHYIAMTKLSKYKKPLRFVFIVIVLLSLVIPAYSRAGVAVDSTISEGEVQALKWVSRQTEVNSVVLSSVEEGNYMTAIGERRNVADSYFLLAPDRYEDVGTMFKTESMVQAAQLLDKYAVDYIYFSDKSKELYNITRLSYVNDNACFKKIYEAKKASVYEVLC